MRVANSEAVIVNTEAKITHLQLLASENAISDASAATIVAEKRIKKGQEHLGSEKEKVLSLRRSHEKDRKALMASQNENFILKSDEKMRISF